MRNGHNDNYAEPTEEEIAAVQEEAHDVTMAINDLLGGRTLRVAEVALIGIMGMYIHCLPKDVREFGISRLFNEGLSAAKFLDITEGEPRNERH